MALPGRRKETTAATSARPAAALGNSTSHSGGRRRRGKRKLPCRRPRAEKTRPGKSRQRPPGSIRQCALTRRPCGEPLSSLASGNRKEKKASATSPKMGESRTSEDMPDVRAAIAELPSLECKPVCTKVRGENIRGALGRTSSA